MLSRKILHLVLWIKKINNEATNMTNTVVLQYDFSSLKAIQVKKDIKKGFLKRNEA